MIYTPNNINSGWECPVCKIGVAPWMAYCSKCEKRPITHCGWCARDIPGPGAAKGRIARGIYCSVICADRADAEIGIGSPTVKTNHSIGE